MTSQMLRLREKAGELRSVWVKVLEVLMENGKDAEAWATAFCVLERVQVVTSLPTQYVLQRGAEEVHFRPWQTCRVSLDNSSQTWKKCEK